MWFNKAPEQRLLAWKKWRESLQNSSVTSLAESVARTWSHAPLSSHYLAPDDPNSWPTPWQLVHDNIYCDLARVLGMFYSISLLKQNINVQLRIYVDNNGWINLLSLEQEKYILNWNHGLVVNTTMTENPTSVLKLVYCYTDLDLSGKF